MIRQRPLETTRLDGQVSPHYFVMGGITCAGSQEWDFSQDATVEKGLISHGGENLLVSLELQQETWGSSRVSMGTSGTRLCGLGKRSVRISVELT